MIVCRVFALQHACILIQVLAGALASVVLSLSILPVLAALVQLSCDISRQVESPGVHYLI